MIEFTIYANSPHQRTNETTKLMTILFCITCGKSSLALLSFSLFKSSGEITKDKKLPFKIMKNTMTSLNAKSLEVISSFVPDRNVPIATSSIPIQMRGFVTLCVRIVASVQYEDLRPRKPCRSMTVTAPSPMINPARVMNVDENSILQSSHKIKL